MRFLIVRKADTNTEAGALPGHELITAMSSARSTRARP
jgi:hypothetical protein